jgi:hypothetical protein
MDRPVVADRRRFHRHAYRDGVLPPSARIRPGQDVTIVNLSPMGMLAEGFCRLSPGTLVEVRLELEHGGLFIDGEVIRSFVAVLDRQRIRYRVAVVFALPISITAPRDLLNAYELPDAPTADAAAGDEPDLATHRRAGRALRSLPVGSTDSRVPQVAD